GASCGLHGALVAARSVTLLPVLHNPSLRCPCPRFLRPDARSSGSAGSLVLIASCAGSAREPKSSAPSPTRRGQFASWRCAPWSDRPRGVGPRDARSARDRLPHVRAAWLTWHRARSVSCRGDRQHRLAHMDLPVRVLPPPPVRIWPLRLFATSPARIACDVTWRRASPHRAAPGRSAATCTAEKSFPGNVRDPPGPE